MVGKLKHSWPDKGTSNAGGGSGSSSSSGPTPGKLKTSSPFGKSVSTTPSKCGNPSPIAKNNSSSTPVSTPGRLKNTSPFVKSSANPPKVGKLNTSTWSTASSGSIKTPSSSNRTSLVPAASNAPNKLKGVKVKVTEGSFKPKSDTCSGIKEAFASGELIVDGGELALNEVSENLQKDNFLDKLVLMNCGIDDAFVTILAKNLREIKHVDISKNNVSEAAQMELITAVLLSNKIMTLKLGGNSKINKANCDKIANMLLDNHCISELEAQFVEKPAKMDGVFDRNRKVNGYLERIKKANSTLDMITRRLSVRDNELVTQMIKAEENDPSIREINIVDDPRFGHIQNTVVVGFAEGLRTNLNLKKLVMKGLDLGNVFLSGLAASIESNFTLEIVDISRNSFTSDGMSEFCQAMAFNESIVKVDLRHQHSPIFSHAEEIVVNALEKNHSVREFQVEFKTPECSGKLQKFLERNQKENKTVDYDKKMIQFLSAEADTVEELAEQRKQEAKPLEIPEDDWEYFYELNEMAKRFQHRLAKETGAETDSEDEGEPTQKDAMRKSLNSRRCTKRSLSDVSGIDKNKVNLAAIQFTNDGAFLTDDFITQYIVDNQTDKSVAFDFGSQFKLFKRFPIESPHRQLIVTKFVDALLGHPRAKEITHINMCNSFLGNDWLVYLCEKCAKDSSLLPKSHLLNLETNFISEPGVIALSKCIASKNTWKYLQAIKLENQKFLLSSKAENELSKALYVNRSVVTVNLRVRNIHERTRIEKYVYRNTDLLRQARRRNKIKTGTLKERKRNKMEQFIDSIAADDPKITEVELVGDQLFLALNKMERLHAAKAFATNKHITKVKMCLLKLDDEFGIEMAKSMEVNTTIESLILESNNFAGEGIKALVGCLAKNNSLTELQLRHQGKTMPSSDETLLAGLIGDNESVLKLGLDLRHMQAKNDVDRRIRQNQDKARKNKKAPPSRSLSSEDMIKSVATQKILERVAKGDKEITSVVLDNDQEFIKMEAFRKKEFFEGMKKNSVVTSLTLNDLQLDNSFAEVLVSILQTNTTLSAISLDKNWFTSLGVYAIVDAIIKKKQIKKLSILKPRAKISNEEAERLLQAMERGGTPLQELKIEFRNTQHAERLRNVLAK